MRGRRPSRGQELNTVARPTMAAIATAPIYECPECLAWGTIDDAREVDFRCECGARLVAARPNSQET